MGEMSVSETPQKKQDTGHISAPRGDWLLRRRIDYWPLACIVLQHVLLYRAWLGWATAGAGARLASGILLAYFAFAAACITHNTIHVRVFHSMRLEGAWLMMLSLAYGHPASTFHSGHNLSHHRYTQSTRDPMRTSKVRFRSNILNVLLFQPLVARDVFCLDVKYLCFARHHRRQLFHQCMREWAAVLAVTAVLVYMDWRRAVMLFYLPHLFAQWGIVTMNFLQHDGCSLAAGAPWVEGASLRREYNMARNFVGPVVNLLTFNNGFHTMHHMMPSIHWRDLPGRHDAEVVPFIHPALNEPCMLRYIVRAFVYPGRRVTFEGHPVVLSGGPDTPDDDWTLEHKTD